MGTFTGCNRSIVRSVSGRSISGTLLFMMAMIFTLLAQADVAKGGEGSIVSKRLPLEDIVGIAVLGPVDVTLKQGDQEYVKATGWPAQLEKMQLSHYRNQLKVEVPRDLDGKDLVVLEIQLKTWKHIDLNQFVQRVQWDTLQFESLDFDLSNGADVQGGTLYGKALSLEFSGRQSANIEQISAKKIDLEVSGAGTIDIAEMNCETELDIELSGSGQLDFPKVKTKDLEVDLAGSGDIRFGDITANQVDLELAGKGAISITDDSTAAQLDVEMAGSGIVKAKPLTAQEATISIAGSAGATVTVKRSLDISVAGSGRVSYWGNPESVTRQVIGRATIRSMQ